MIYYLAIFFSLLSSLRLNFLPEFQLGLVILTAFIFYKKPNSFLFLLFTILCTHHYAIPDALLRFSSENYPSIYTKSYGPLKLLDVVVVVCLCYSIRWLKHLIRLCDVRYFPSILIFLSFIGLIYIGFERFALGNFLFVMRNMLLLLAIYLISSRLTEVEIVKLCKVAMVAWISKMALSIFFVHDSPLYRQIFGFDGIIFFAGDEYLSLGFYAVSLMLLAKNYNIDFSKSSIWVLMVLALILALVAQRKGAVQYFFILYGVMFLGFYVKSKIVDRFFNFLLIVNAFSIFIFVNLIIPYMDDLIKLAFLEYAALSESSKFSLMALNNYEFYLGISAFGMYELVGLPQVFDHAMSFGEEVGEKFRYQLWTIPGGRLFLNVGLIGFLYYYLYIFFVGLRFNSSVFYLLFGVSSVFYFANVTPVSAIAIGVALSVLVRYFHRRVN